MRSKTRQLKNMVSSNLKSKAIEAYHQRQSFLMELRSSNPISTLHQEGFIPYTIEEQELIDETDNSAQIIITEEHNNVLKQFHEDTAQCDTPLGELYQQLNYKDMVMRLYHDRYRTIYLDGRVVLPRDDEDTLARAKKPDFLSFFKPRNAFFPHRKLLQQIGTEQDQYKAYLEYLTLDEMMLSPLVLPQMTSIIIGTGSRNEVIHYQDEMDNSTDLAVISSPVGAEFRNGATLHHDLMMMCVTETVDSAYHARRQTVIQNTPLIKAARSLYGNTLALDLSLKDTQGRNANQFVAMTLEHATYWLYKPAYKARMKAVLAPLLVSSDLAMYAGNTGTVFNLKGLGLGAFGFTPPDCVDALEQLYIETVQECLDEIAPQLKQIRFINIINLPSDLSRNLTGLVKIESYGPVELVRSLCNPTQKYLPSLDQEIGGTHFCGDSGAVVGNEAGFLPNTSSDDPATMHSLLNPEAFDPDKNRALSTSQCIKSLSIKDHTLGALFDEPNTPSLSNKQ